MGRRPGYLQFGGSLSLKCPKKKGRERARKLNSTLAETFPSTSVKDVHLTRFPQAFPVRPSSWQLTVGFLWTVRGYKLSISLSKVNNPCCFGGINILVEYCDDIEAISNSTSFLSVTHILKLYMRKLNLKSHKDKICFYLYLIGLCTEWALTKLLIK